MIRGIILSLGKFVKKRPVLVVVCLVLAVITVVSVKPDFYLMGWDNYSSQFNLKTNFFRTLFATWREYRGLGVPSDAEVTDIFRISLYGLLHLFLPTKLLDQVFYMLALWLGVLGAYWLAIEVWREKLNRRMLDVAGGVTAFFYLFNLNTLSIFYSPMVPFTNRFYGLPWLLYWVLRYERKKDRSSKVWLILVVLLSSGSYITPTVLITNLLALGIFGLFELGIRKTAKYLTLFGLLNLFWILPFVNYTREKASVVPMARTFIEINESMLNSDPKGYGLDNQIILNPSFLGMKFGSLTGTDNNIHPQWNEFQPGKVRYQLYLWPILYGLGALLLIVRLRRNWRGMWLLAWILVFLFLSGKEYGPGGGLYSWLGDNIPNFRMIFRISDTKFHAYMALSGALLAAYLVGVIVNWKRFILGLVVVMLGLYGWKFRAYFDGNLMGFVYNDIPVAYFEAAKIINEDKDEGRVLHLPMVTWQEYWRSYSWGYFGSAWFNFLIDKPYIDKTFEPASMENSYVHEKIRRLTEKYVESEIIGDKEETVEEFGQLMSELGVRYLLVDESLGSEVYPRDLVYGAKLPWVWSMELVNDLATKGMIKERAGWEMDLKKQVESYRKLYPVNVNGVVLDVPQNASLRLYEVVGVEPMVSTVSEVELVDAKLENLVEADRIGSEVKWQQAGVDGVIKPLIRQNHRLEIGQEAFELNYPTEGNGGSYMVKVDSSEESGWVIDVEGKLVKDKVVFSLYHRYYPDINGRKFRRYIGEVKLPVIDTTVMEGNEWVVGDWPNETTAGMLASYRLRINETVIPITNLGTVETRMGTVMIHGNKISLDWLKGEEEEMGTWSPATADVCYGASSGSWCVMSNVGEGYNEVTIDLEGRGGVGLSQVYGCLLNDFGECNNNHRLIAAKDGWQGYRIIGEKSGEGGNQLLVVGAVAQAGKEIEVTIGEAEITRFKAISHREIDIKPEYLEEEVVIDDEVMVGIPRMLGKYSYQWQKEIDIPMMPVDYCSQDKGRTITKEGNIIKSSFEGCAMFADYPVNYYYNSPYLMFGQYWRQSGQQPLVQLKRKNKGYGLQRLSLYQGYPIEEEGMINYSVLWPTMPKNEVSAEMTVNMFQMAANKGEIQIGEMGIVEYPRAWESLTLVSADSRKNYATVEGLEYQQILPSWWRVRYIGNGGKILLRFNQAYDRQWVVVGKKAIGGRCQGVVNCFELEAGEGEQRVEIVYWPEILSMVGWTITGLTAGLLLKRWKRSARTEIK